MGIDCRRRPKCWLNTIFVIFALFFGSSRTFTYASIANQHSQTYDFKTSEASERLTGGGIYAHGMPDTIIVWCNEWDEIMANPTSWGNDLKLKSNNTFVKFYVDNLFPTTLYGGSFNYTYRLTYQIYGYTDPTDTISTYTQNSDTLTISYNNNAYNSPYQDLHLKKYSGFYKAMIIVTGIYEDIGGGVALADISQIWRQNFEVEGSILTQRYDKSEYGPGSALLVNVTPSSYNVLDLDWSFVSGLDITPVNYELEWTYVDDYSVDPSTGAVSNLSASDISYNFSHNATRVCLHEKNYSIPVTYPSGYIVYRVRPVRPDSVLYQHPVYGDWSLYTTDIVSNAISNNAAYQVNSAYTNDSLNWQYTITFAEGGKYKHVASFYDGLLKNRQSITRFNAYLSKLITTTNIYDFEGHLAIKTLPAPVDENDFHFLSGIAINSATGNSYRANDFDTGFANCPLTDSLSPMASGSLASIYYSNQNPDTFGVQHFVPDAEGYPLVQTEYQPGYNDRINKQGGAGKSLQLNTNHILQNYYTSASQTTLNMLFGVNAGWQSYYRSTVSSDPNNQLSMTVTDYEGRQVMTCMIGPGNDTTTGYALMAADVPASFSLREDLLYNTPQQVIGHTKTADYDFFNQANGVDSLQYLYSYAPFPVCPGQALSVKAHYMYEVTDQCGNIVCAQDSVLGVNGVVTGPAVPFAGAVSTFFAGIAPYHVHKELTVDPADMTATLDSYMAAPPNCFLSEPYFIRKAVESRNFPCPAPITSPCEQRRWELLQELFPGAKYGQYTVAMDTIGTVGPTVVGTSNSIFTAFYDVSSDLWHYRYQDTCTIPSLPDTMSIGGVLYYPLRTMRADSFVSIYNKAIGLGDYRIAEYLLPLHPEYCNLRNCFDDTFKLQVLAIPNATVAENLHLLLLDSIVHYDSFVTLMTNAYGPSGKDSLMTYPGGLLSLDTMALINAYCNCGDSVMYRQCTDMFAYEISNNLLINDKVKSAYFSKIQSLYFQNRQRFVDRLLNQGGNTCAHCALVRMTLVAPPVFPPITIPASGVISIDTPIVDSAFLASINLVPLTTPSGSIFSGTMDSTMQALYDSTLVLYNYADSSLCYGQIDSIIARLSNCFAGDTVKRDTLKHYLQLICAYRLGFTPETITQALLASGISPDDLCNPFLISYPTFADTSSQNDFNCRPDSLFLTAGWFLSDTAVVHGLSGRLITTGIYRSYTLDTVHSMFEREITAVLGHNVDMNLFASYDSANNVYALYIYNNPALLPSNIDTVKLFLRSPLCRDMFLEYATDSIAVTVSCINTYTRPTGTGLVNEYSFIADVSAYPGSVAVSCTMLGWIDSIQTMYDKSNVISKCIPCTQMKQLYTQFQDTMQAYQVYGTNHPYYDQMMRSFMNYSLRKMYSSDQYQTFIESCALADSTKMPMYHGDIIAIFTDSADMRTFLHDLNQVDTDYSFNNAYTIRTSATQVIMLIHLNDPAPWLYWKYREFATTYTGPNAGIYVNAPVVLGDMGFVAYPASYTPTFNAWDLVDTNYVKYNDAGIYDLWVVDHFEPRHFYTIDFKAGAPPPYVISRTVYGIQSYLYNNGIPGVYNEAYQSTINDDYFKPEKQDYLRYVYGFQHMPPYQVLDSIQAQYLLTGIPSYSGYQASYSQPFNPNIVTNLYMSNPSMSNHYLDTLTMVLDSVASLNTVHPGYIFFDTNKVVVITTPDSPLIAYRCSDGTYWYRYFTGGDTMYNIYVHIPDYVPRYLHKQYQVTAIIPALGDSVSRFFTLELQRPGDPVKIYADGLTSFVIGRNVELDNVLLGLPITSTATYAIPDTFNNCERSTLASAMLEGVNNYRDYIDSIKAAITANFLAYMMDSVHEELLLSYINNQFAYTLYHYDRAGNLVGTIPPEGVHPVPSNAPGIIDSARAAGDETAVVTYTKQNYFLYNTINAVMWQGTINGGVTGYVYDEAGRLVASQNEKQAHMSSPQATYTLYDRQGRVTETGQVEAPPGLSTAAVQGITLGYDTVSDYVYAHDRTDVVMTIYDTVATNLQTIAGLDGQKYLRKRVAAVKYFDTLHVADSARADYTHATHYSYDIHGNVSCLVQDFPELAAIKQRYKRVDYDYDQISGKVNMLSYNRGFADQYYQRYMYDEDNRIKNVSTSADGYIWKQDAEYTYYEHGPLARIDLGDLRVQGIDYAYTIQGWLKVVNGDTLDAAMDMGLDGDPSGAINAPDKVAYTVDYFNNDYKPIAVWPMQHTPAGRNLYNGNIAGQTVAIDTFRRLHKQYVYDQMNRIKTADYFSVDAVTNTIAGLNDYHSNYRYDLDGNILGLVRYGNNTGTGATIMDSLHYFYPTGSDRLANVHDSVSDNYTNQLEKYFTPGPDRYQYDNIGNVTMDLVSGQDTIEWNLYNKVTRTVNNTDTSSMMFTYDAMGHRVAKHYIKTTPSGKKQRDDYYVHDAQGNILAVYHGREKFNTGDTLEDRSYSLAEHNIYGGSRLGVKGYYPLQLGASWDYVNGVMDTSRLIGRLPWYSLEYQDLIKSGFALPYGNANTDSGYAQHVTGQKQYELTDHLGNVMATVSDQRTGNTFTPVTGSLTVDSPANIATYKGLTESAYDYYPFGQMMPGRYMRDTNMGCFTATLTESIPYFDTLLPGYYDSTINVQANWYNASCAPCGITWRDSFTIYDTILYEPTGVLLIYAFPTAPISTLGKALFPLHGLRPGNMTHIKVVAPLLSNITGLPSTTVKCLEIFNSVHTPLVTGYSINPPGYGPPPLTTDRYFYASFIPTDTVAYVTLFNCANGGWGDSMRIDSVFTIDTNHVWIPPVLDTLYQSINVLANVCGEDHYHYGHNGQMKTNEIAGVGNHYTAQFWEYDPRLGRRWNLDPKPNVWESTYAVFGDNPIWHKDVLGDKWKNKDDEKKADELRKAAGEKKDEYNRQAEQLLKKAEEYAKKGDERRADQARQNAQHYQQYSNNMAQAQSELQKMGDPNTEQVFTFGNREDNGFITYTVMNAQGEIVIPFIDIPNSFHEAHHGYQHLTGDLEFLPGTRKARKLDLWDERSSYIRQYIYDPSSVNSIHNESGIRIMRATDITIDYVSKMYYIDDDGNHVKLYENISRENKFKNE